MLALLVFDVCYAAFRVAVARRAPRERAARPPAFPMVLAFVAVLALATYALRIVLPSGTWVPGIDFPSSAYLPQYAAFFVAGAVAYRRGWFLTVTPAWAGPGSAWPPGPAWCSCRSRWPAGWRRGWGTAR
ncbi:hypothetical protein ACFQ0B_50545 [Nonomuraea thailandensis]